MKMKKYLITAALAVAISGAFVSCSDDVSYDSLIEQKAKTFEQTFIEAYGTPAPNHTWGFKKNNITKGDVITRTSHPNNNQWGDPNYYGYVVPSTPSSIEREYVMEWFSHVRQGHGQTLDVNDYFVQQIGYGEDYAGDWGNCKYQPNAQYLEKYENGEPYYRTEHPTVQSKNQMDWIAANLTAQTANRSDIGLNLYAQPGDSNGEGFNDFDHIYNFNAGSGEIMLMKDSETQYGFSFHDSYGTDDKLVTQNYYMVHLVADYKGEHIDGWYVGFDYQTLKKETYNDGTHYVEYNYLELQPDGRYNDRVVKIVPAGGIPDEFEETTIIEHEEIVEAGRVFCEDLGASSRSDIDYNDVVFDGIIVHEWKMIDGVKVSDGYYAKVCLLAAGGTIPVTVGGHEIHGVLSENKVGTNIMINTIKEEDRAEVNGAGVFQHAPVVIDRIDNVTSLDGIQIYALYNNKIVEVTNNGENLAPYKICVPIGTRWAKERVDIGIAYKDFSEYCKTGPEVKFWEEETKINSESLWDDSATPSPFLGYKEGQVIKHDVVTMKTVWNNNGSGEVNWNGTYRFGKKGLDYNNECITTFKENVWNKIKNGTFYLVVEGTSPQIRVTNGWWEQGIEWQSQDITPDNSLLTKNEDEDGVWDGTWTLTVNLTGSNLVNTIDQKHLLFTGKGYTPVKLYYIE